MEENRWIVSLLIHFPFPHLLLLNSFFAYSCNNCSSENQDFYKYTIELTWETRATHLQKGTRNCTCTSHTTSIISCIHSLSERHSTWDSLKKKYISPFYASFQFGIYIAQKITTPFPGDVSIWLSVPQTGAPFLEMVIEVSTWTGLRGCSSSSNTVPFLL